MKKSLIEVYALVACFASMVFLVVSVATCLNEFLRIVAPSVTVSAWALERSLSDEEFLRSWPQGHRAPEPSAIPRLRTAALESALRSERHDGLRSFLQSLMYTIAAGLVFSLHWRLAQREQTETVPGQA